MKKILSLSLIMMTSVGFAKSYVNINVTSYGNAVTQGQKDQIDAAAKDLESQINNQLPSSDVDNFLKNSGNASVLANSGNNYYSPKDGILLGIIAGGAGQFHGKKITEISEINAEEIEGVGLGGGIVLGISPSKFMTSELLDLSRMQVSISAISGGINISDAQIKYSSFGLNTSYRVIPEKDLFYLVKWNGLDLNAGVKYSKTKIDFKKDLNITGDPTTVDYGGGLSADLTPNFTGVVLAGAEISSWQIPLEVSSSVEVLKVFQFFGGLGIDITQGTAKGKGTATGPVNVTSSNPGLTGTITADVLADMDSEQSIDTFTQRYFLGAALDFKYLSVSIQMNKSLSNNNEGLTLGFFSNF